jgi:hypothetical protein
MMKVKVFTENERVLQFSVDNSWTIGRLKSEIKSSLGASNSAHVKLIFGGRIVDDEFKLLTSFAERISSSSFSSEVIISFHAFITSSSSAELRREAMQNHPIGFDRFLSAGFSAEDIEQMRQSFHGRRRLQTQDMDLESGLPTIARGQWTQEQIQAEDSWMDDLSAADGHQQASLSEDDDPYFEWTCSVIMGFFLGIVSILILRRKQFMFSQRQQAGIIIGLFMNVIYALFLGFF